MWVFHFLIFALSNWKTCVLSKIRQILPAFSHFCLVLMLSVLANGVLFFHSHELANGKIITHAHPILTAEQESLPDHGHTETELITLDLIAHADYYFLAFEVPIPGAVALPELFETVRYSEEIYFGHSIGFDHRGPPSGI